MATEYKSSIYTYIYTSFLFVVFATTSASGARKLFRMKAILSVLDDIHVKEVFSQVSSEAYYTYISATVSLVYVCMIYIYIYIYICIYLFLFLPTALAAVYITVVRT